MDVNAKRITRAAGELAPMAEPSDFRRTFARNLRSAREEVGISQRELAKLAGVSQRYISEIETSSKNVSMDVITVLSRHVGKSEIDLLTPQVKR